MDADDDGAGGPVVPGYQLHEVLGRSGTATVHRATQTSVDRPVALKILAAGPLDAAAGRRFRQEALAAGALADHPHVLAPTDAGTTTAGAPFVAMPLVPAGSLGDRLRAFGPLPPREVARLGAEIADALEAAHAAGILHGHVTPDNVLVGRRGQALLADFGSATVDEGPGAEGRREPPSPAGDVHGLGATLYALAAGRAASTDAGAGPDDDPPPLPPEVPFALVDVIGACLAPEPAERPALGDVATTLEEIAAGTPRAPVSAAVPDEPDERPGAAGPTPPPSPDPGAGAGAPPARPRPTGPGFPTRRLVVVAVLVALSMLAAVVLTLVLGGDEDALGDPDGRPAAPLPVT